MRNLLMKKLAISAMVLLLFTLVTSVKADTLAANIGDTISLVSTTGVDGSTNSGSWPVIYGYMPNSGGGGASSIYAGGIDWSGTDSSNSVGAQNFIGYCTQLTTDVYVPSAAPNYTVTQLQNSDDIALAPNAAARAYYIQALVGALPQGAFDGLYNPADAASIDPVVSAAVQVSVWELVYNGLNDVVAGTGFDLTNNTVGKFSLATSANGGNAFTDSVITLATSYLDGILTDGSNGYGGVNYALTNAPVAGFTNSTSPGSGSQNQIIILSGADQGIIPAADTGAAAPLPTIPSAVPVLLVVCGGFAKLRGARRKLA